jgi:hypothetical protein
MPLPKPKPNEEKNDFVNRCMTDDKMKEEYSDPMQRLAVCDSLYINQDDNNV